MTRTHRVTTVLALMLALAFASFETPRAAVAEQPSTLPDLMRLKLSHAQEVLRALVLEDYAGLDRAAQQLGALTKAAAWGVLKTPEYARYSSEFLRATEGLASAARARKLDAASGEYANVTQGCVNCHRYIRGTRLASLDDWRRASPVIADVRLRAAHE